MPTGSFGTASTPLSKLFTERVVLTERTSDPSNPAKGAIWFRSDLDSGTDKFGEIRWYDGSSTNSVPVFDKGTSASGVEEVLGIATKNGIAFIPTAARADAAYPQISVRHAGNDLGFHDAQSLVTTMIDDFEDGDINIEAADWSGWSNNTGALTAQQSTVLAGSYSAELTASNTQNTVIATRAAEATINIELKIQIGSDTGNTTDRSQVRLFDGSGAELADLEFEDGGTVYLNGSSITTWSAGTTYTVVFKMDYGNDQVTVNIDGTDYGPQNFTNSGAGTAEIFVVNDTNSSGNSRSVFFDDVAVP